MEKELKLYLVNANRKVEARPRLQKLLGNTRHWIVRAYTPGLAVNAVQCFYSSFYEEENYSEADNINYDWMDYENVIEINVDKDATGHTGVVVNEIGY